MDTKASTNFWWLKSSTTFPQNSDSSLAVPKLDLHSSNSLADFLEHDKDNNVDSDVDVGSIIEEINRVAAQSPLGPYEKLGEERDVEDLMREAERIYIESSKSFEQLSQRSKTSQNITDLLSNFSKNSTPTPKSVSPLPMDPDPESNTNSDSDEYTEDFSEESKVESNPSPLDKDNFNFSKGEIRASISENNFKSLNSSNVNYSKEDINKSINSSITVSKSKSVSSFKDPIVSRNSQIPSEKSQSFKDPMSSPRNSCIIEEQHISQVNNNLVEPKEIQKEVNHDYEKRLNSLNELIDIKNNSIKTLEESNQFLKLDIEKIKVRII